MTNFSSQFKSLIPPGLPQIPQAPVPLRGNVTLGEGASFKDVFTNMLGKVNNMMGKTEQLTEASVTTGKVNLHEVMIAMAEEEIAIGLTTQVAGKFISTVEKLTQMQV